MIFFFIHHDIPLSGHSAFDRTYNRIKDRYYFKNMKQRVQEYCKSCIDCQQRRLPHGFKYGLMVVPKGKVICEKWFCDSIGPFPWSEDGNRHILIAMESYTRWTVTQAVSDITAETIHKFVTRIVTTFGCFRYLVTDNARAFHSDLLKRLSSSLGYKHYFITPYHAQSNSVERVNSTLVGMLAQYCSQDQTDWDFQLEACTFAINTLTNRSIRTTPYYLMFQRQPLLPADLPTSESLSSRKNRWQLACKLAEEQTKLVQQYNKSYYDKKRQISSF